MNHSLTVNFGTRCGVSCNPPPETPRPRALADLSALDCGLTLFGHALAAPVFVAPTSNHQLVLPEGEMATVRGAGDSASPFVLSSSASTDINDVVAAARSPVWFQLYAQRDRGLTRDMIQHAEASGAKAICLTVDSPVDGIRNRQDRAAARPPAEAGHPNYLGRNPGRCSVQTLEEVRPSVIRKHEQVVAESLD